MTTQRPIDDRCGRAWFVGSRLALAFLVVTLPCVTVAQQPVDFSVAAASLQDATVTVRVSRPLDAVEGLEFGDDGIGLLPEGGGIAGIDVFSGVAIANRLVVTPMLWSSGAEVRITLSDGEQAVARPLVVDEYTGLVLLEIDKDALATLSLSEQKPNVGSWIVSASAFGIERPVISSGTVGSTDTRISGTGFPPMLLCDLPTIETSSGSPVANPSGELVGLVVASTVDRGRGWTYVIPSQYISRLTRILEQRVEERAAAQGEANQETNEATQTEGTPINETPINEAEFGSLFDDVIVIQRRRPIVGMVLDDDGENIVVARVTPDGPAEAAGIQVGDVIVGLERYRIRSVYQAVFPTFHYQPGDVLNYQIEHNGVERQVSILLGGDVVLPRSSLESIQNYVDPKLQIQSLNQMLANAAQQPEINGDASVTNTFSEPASASSTQSLLERAIVMYQTVIALQQEQLKTQQEKIREEGERIESLEQTVRELQEQIKQPSGQ